MSDDLPGRDPSGGYIVLPRKIRFAALAAVIVAVFSLGGWIAVLHADTASAKETSDKAITEVESVRVSLYRIERHMCLECRLKQRSDPQPTALDCSDICVSRRVIRRSP